MIPDRIMRKIQRCLALSQSSNGNEAGTALRQAQSLMAQYGVSQKDLAIADFDVVAQETGAGQTPPRYLDRLAQLINGAFGTTTVYSVRWAQCRYRGIYEFVGPRDAVKVAGYAFEVLQRQLVRDRQAFLATQNPRIKRSTKTLRGDAFAEAWVLGAHHLIVPMAMSDEVRALHKTFRQQRYGKLNSLAVRDHKPLRHHDLKARKAGYVAGKAARLSAGVSATEREELTHG